MHEYFMKVLQGAIWGVSPQSFLPKDGFSSCGLMIAPKFCLFLPDLFQEHT